MKTIKTKVELVQQMSELRSSLNNIKGGFAALSSTMTEASIQIGQLDNALSKLENAEVTTELMETKTFTDSKINWWALLIAYLLGCLISYGVCLLF